MGEKKYDVELAEDEYQALMNNRMIASLNKNCLRHPKNAGNFVILRMSRLEMEDLAGWAAAESNHAKTAYEEELLGSACDSLEAALIGSSSFKSTDITS